MIGNTKLVLDTHCEVYDLLKPWADGIFWNLEEHMSDGKLVPNALYLIGREQVRKYSNIVQQLVTDNTIKVVFSNPAEGSETLRMHCKAYGIEDLVIKNKILLIGGGDMGPEYNYLRYDSFLPKILDYEENLLAQKKTDEIFNTLDKPYKFFFLNGRARPHRKFLLEKFKKSGLIDSSIWSCLDSNAASYKNIQLFDNNENLMTHPTQIKYLDKKYEHARYQKWIESPAIIHNGFVKHALFDDDWGEVYIEPQGYIDTYFSLITETVFEYPYSFRTEKIWKPIAMGHPWIAVANQGFYRDMNALGFKTFGDIINEEYDNETDPDIRIKMIINEIVKLNKYT
jgi:hypothetical protein